MFPVSGKISTNIPVREFFKIEGNSLDSDLFEQI